MKKILSTLFVTFVFFALALPSLAVITPEEAMSETYIQGHGHSAEMSRLIDLQHSQINATQTQYKNGDPTWYGDKKVSLIRRVFMYFDCGLDDEKFMQHKIKYTQNWNEDL